ncbi:MAG TPA: hypothetical protein VFX96_20045 [Pyrinomonadaceae bacterium]|nr:hypothetical protein [Pyrinomonadaceae bacterium]
MRKVLVLVGILLGAAGGVIAYRAAFIAPRAGVLVTDESVRELPDLLTLAGGLALLIIGALLAYISARRRA